MQRMPSKTEPTWTKIMTLPRPPQWQTLDPQLTPSDFIRKVYLYMRSISISGSSWNSLIFTVSYKMLFRLQRSSSTCKKANTSKQSWLCHPWYQARAALEGHGTATGGLLCGSRTHRWRGGWMDPAWPSSLQVHVLRRPRCELALGIHELALNPYTIFPLV